MAEEDRSFTTFDGVTITKSDYRDDLKMKYMQAVLDGLTKVTDFSVGSEAYHLIDMIAGYLLEHREDVDLNYRMSMIHTAVGEFLDNFGDMGGVHRKQASPSTGVVTFTRLDNTTLDSEIIIPDGLQVATDDAISFIVDNDGENLVLNSGVMAISANVICEQEGSYTNVEQNSISLIMGDLGNLLSVTNDSAFTEGEDLEEDDDYRSRILLSPYQPPTGTLAWYENVARTITSVSDVKVEKSNVAGYDVNIIFQPVNRLETVTLDGVTMTKAEAELRELFNLNEYAVVGVNILFTLADIRLMLQDAGDLYYYFAVALDTNYNLDMVKQKVIDKITQFNKDATISTEFNANNLAIIIDNEIEGINNCKIVKYDNNTGVYSEITGTIEVEGNEVYQVDMNNIEDKIKVMHFNLDIIGG